MATDELELPSEFAFTAGNDVAVGADTKASITEDAFGILVDGDTSTGAGDDILLGSLTVDSIDAGDPGLEVVGVELDGEDILLETEEDDDSIIGFGEIVETDADGVGVFGLRSNTGNGIETGGGNDLVAGVGIGRATGNAAMNANGIFAGGKIDTGDDDDGVFGIADASAESDGFSKATGIFLSGESGGEISTGSGADTVIGFAESSGGVTSESTGIRGKGNVIDTGEGADDDQVIGVAIASGGTNFTKAAGITGIDISTGDGNDLVLGDATATAGVPPSGEENGTGARGIEGTSVDTGAGMDTVTGTATAILGDDAFGRKSAGITDSTIMAGDDSDEVTGSVDITIGEDSTYRDASGIVGVQLMDDDGDNDIFGSASVVGGNRSSFKGLDGIAAKSGWTLGDGDDSVTGSVEVELGIAGSVFDAVGLHKMGLDMGDGENFVTGTAEVFGSNAASVKGVSGIGKMDLMTGDDDDQIVGSVDAFVGIGGEILGFSGATGIGAKMMTGGGADLVVGIYEASGQGGADIREVSGIFSGRNDGPIGHKVGIIEPEPKGPSIGLGDGENVLAGITFSDVTDAGNIIRNSGIAQSQIMSGDDDDIIAGLAFAEGNNGTRIVDNDGITGTDIMTNGGDDIVFGLADISGSDLGDAFGTGINAGKKGFIIELEPVLLDGEEPIEIVEEPMRPMIATGEGEDSVIGIGADVANVSDGPGPGPRPALVVEEPYFITKPGSYGISGYSIDLGADNDFVFARGATAGVQAVMISGEGGDDTFDLHSGTGMVDGGEGDEEEDVGDLLILSGDSEDYFFEEIFNGSDEDGTITDRATKGGETHLMVDNIERFQFDDGTFEFDDLFFIPI